MPPVILTITARVISAPAGLRVLRGLFRLRVRLCRCRVRLCGSRDSRCRVGRRHSSRTVAGTAAFISLVAGRDLLRLFNRHFVVGTFLPGSCGDGCIPGGNGSYLPIGIDGSDLLVAGRPLDGSFGSSLFGGNSCLNGVRVTDRQLAFVGIERDAFDLIECFHMSRLLGDLFAILHEGRGDVAFTRLQDLNPAVFIDGGHCLISRSVTHLHIGGISRAYSCLDSGFVSIVELDVKVVGNGDVFRGHFNRNPADSTHLRIRDACSDVSFTCRDSNHHASGIDRRNTLIGGGPLNGELLGSFGHLFVGLCAFTGCCGLRSHGGCFVGAVHNRQGNTFPLLHHRRLRNRDVRDFHATPYQGNRHRSGCYHC